MGEAIDVPVAFAERRDEDSCWRVWKVSTLMVYAYQSAALSPHVCGDGEPGCCLDILGVLEWPPLVHCLGGTRTIGGCRNGRGAAIDHGYTGG